MVYQHRTPRAIPRILPTYARWPWDVIALHLIGHSRGSVVISQAMQELLESPAWADSPLARGYIKMTFLDPHPANNDFGYNASLNPFFPAPYGYALDALYTGFQLAVRDPEVFVPSRVNEAEEYFQRNSFATLPLWPLGEFFLNLQGIMPEQIHLENPHSTRFVNQIQLGMPGIGHSEVHEYYQALITGERYSPPVSVVSWLLRPTQVPETERRRAITGQAYNLFLGREPAEQEIAVWTNGSGDVAQIMRGIGRSREAHVITVQNLYRTLLRREAEVRGLNGWVAHLDAGASVEEVTGGIAGSDEYFLLHGGTVGGFLDGLYEDLLRREADDVGRESWRAWVAAGMTRDQVAALFLASREYSTSAITACYVGLLNRGPDAVGFGAWLAALEQGLLRPTDLVFEFLGSLENLARLA